MKINWPPSLLLLVTLLLSESLLAGPTATLTGRVTDSDGGIIAGVRVEAVHGETNITFSGETNDVGLYNIPDLPPGTYRVTLQKSNFRSIIKPDVDLHVEDVVLLNFSMQIGPLAQSITVEGGAPLIEAGAQRGGNFLSNEVSGLPLIQLNPISLARTLAGVSELKGTALAGDRPEAFSVNGQRLKANNYLIDGTENNDIALTGIAQPFNMVDAVQEVSVQTGNFGVEFGRAGGGIFNVVTKSGTNSFHGTVLWRYQSQRFNSVSNLDKLNQTPKSVFNRNVYGFTVGGPVARQKTFFFTGFQQDTRRYTRNFSLVVPTDATVARLRSIFPSNPRLDMYLGSLGSLRGTGNPFPLQLGVDPQTGVNRGEVLFAAAALALPASLGGPQWLGKLDHSLSEKHRVGVRYIFDSTEDLPASVFFPGFITEGSQQNQNVLLTDHYTFSPTWTNEFRLSYARQEAFDARISATSDPLARTLPRILIANIATPGIPSNGIQYRKVNNVLLQVTQTKLSGSHTFRYGVEFLKQLAAQRPAAVTEGEVTYSTAPGYSAFANFLDDFSGPSGRWRRDFGATVFYPKPFRQSYFFQDTWLAAPSLSVTLGLRYENFDQVANALPYPAFAGFDPARFLEPNRVNTDNNNFGPAVGLAWRPFYRSGWLAKLFGADKTVFRGGFQISYDAFHTQLLSLMLAASSPNGISVDTSDVGTGPRGAPDWFMQLPVGRRAPSVADDQAGPLDKDLRSPYTERWSFGFQRQFSNEIVLDASYVGTVSHKLTTWSDVNPRQLSGTRPYPELGLRHIRTSEGNSSYHAMQLRLERRFARGLHVNASYTWSKSLDSTSDGVAAVVSQGTQRNLTSVPLSQGGLKLDHGPSDYDRPHRLTVVYMWSIPGPAGDFWKHLLGGWSIAGIASFQSGAAYSLMNGFDRNNDGWNNDRPDIGNPNAPLNSRAVLTPATGPQACPTGYRNMDTGVCVNPADVRWVQAILGLPNASTAGRNTLRTGGVNSMDVTVTKSFSMGEFRRLEFRWEAMNALNHPQFTEVPGRNVGTTPPLRFLNRDFTNSGTRTMWAQVKLVF